MFTEEQVKEVCISLGLDIESSPFSLKNVTDGANTELEHGTAAKAFNITNDDITMTVKIALAHLTETPRYYNDKIGLESWERSIKKSSKNTPVKLEHKTVQFKADEIDGETGIIAGYASVFGNVDQGRDIVEQGAFTKTIAEGVGRVKILFNHSEEPYPLGKPLELREDARGLFIKGQITKTDLGANVLKLIKDNVLSEFSIGYEPIVFDYDSDGVRHLREVKLWEVSVVVFAMNPEAVITSKKIKIKIEEQLWKKLNLKT